MTEQEVTKYSVDERLRIYVKLFRLAGLELVEEDKSVRFNIFSGISIFCSHLTAIAVILDIFYTDDTTENIRLLIAIFTAMSLHHFVRLRKEKLVRLMILSKSFTWEDMTEGMGLFIPTTKKVVIRAMISALIIHVSVFFAQASILPYRILSINGYYIFDWTISPMYEVVTISQFIASLAYASVASGIMGLYATMLCIACSQVQKFKNNLLEVKQINKYSSSEESIIQTSKEMFQNMQKQLNRCIYHHQQTLEYMCILEETWNELLLIMFFVSLVGICFSAFSLVSNLEDILQPLKSMLTYIAYLMFVGTFCWFGGKLTDEVAEIKDAAWSTDWVGTPISFQQCIHIIITATTRDFTLTAGKFIPVNNETLMSVLKQTFSYLMFLIQVQEQNLNAEAAN